MTALSAKRSQLAHTTVVCCAEIPDPNWRWVESYFTDSDIHFEFARCPRRHLGIAFFNFTRLLGCFEAVRKARRSKAQLIVAHGPALAAWCALFVRMFRIKTHVLGHSFNFTSMPGKLKRNVFRVAYSSVSRFVVFSQVEKEIYSKVFNVPIERFDFVHWGVQVPTIAAEVQPVESGDYVAAIGGNARDYPTLVEAARKQPHVRFVLVVRPGSLAGLKIPQNVSVYTNLPFDKAMNILRYSRFMALPLIAGDVPCGHVTLVAAMHLGKAIVVTKSKGIRDYVCDQENALVVDAGSAQALADAIATLWGNRELCCRLGESGRTFAANKCTEARVAEHFAAYLCNAITVID